MRASVRETPSPYFVFGGQGTLPLVFPFFSLVFILCFWSNLLTTKAAVVVVVVVKQNMKTESSDQFISARELEIMTKNMIAENDIPDNAVELLNDCLRNPKKEEFVLSKRKKTDGSVTWTLRPNNVVLSYDQIIYLAEVYAYLFKKLKITDQKEGSMSRLPNVDRKDLEHVSNIFFQCVMVESRGIYLNF